MVLDEIAPARIEPVAGAARRGTFALAHAGGLTHEMDHPALWYVPAFPASPRRAQGKVEFLIIKKIGLIQQPHVLQDIAADQHRRARHPVDPGGLARKFLRHDAPAVEKPGDRPDPDLGFELAGDRKKPEGAGLRRAVRVFQSGPGYPDLRPGPRKRNEAGNRRRIDNRIRIEQQKKIRSAELFANRLDPSIVGVGKSAIDVERKQRDPALRIPAFDLGRNIFRRAVPRRSIHDHHMRAIGQGGIVEERGHTPDGQVRRAEINNNNRQIHGQSIPIIPK